MKNFLDEDFLLESETARRLYHGTAKNMPIYDYHCHISAQEILENRAYDNITQVWLYGDHYKWRLMRAAGTEERLVTGAAQDYDKFLAFAGTIPLCLGNPLYHWSHLELRRYFGVDTILSEETALDIWKRAEAQLGENGLRCRDFITRSRVKLICTTDDPADDLRAHIALQTVRREEDLPFRVVPAFRPDKALNIGQAGFSDYIERLGAVVGQELTSVEKLVAALRDRMDFFHEQGCRLSDHGQEYIPYREAALSDIEEIYLRALARKPVSQADEDKFKTRLMLILAAEYKRRGWVMQLHLGAMRNNNQKMFRLQGPDTGYDSIGGADFVRHLSRFLDALEARDRLPKTVLYCLDPKDNYALLTLAGCFQGETPGKIQFGSAWWFADHESGIRKQLGDLADLGVLGLFVGMLTDSRSFLSYTRHEYFRRILCSFIGQQVESGRYPNDDAALERIVRGVCYDNAVKYFGMEV